jgi:hypothetical protein
MGKILQKIEENIDLFLINIKKQASNTKEAGAIIEKYIKEGKITEEEEKILQTQLWDSLKIVGVVIPFVLIPGASLLMPLILKVAEKNDIELLPTAFQSEKKDRKDLKRVTKKKRFFTWKKPKNDDI